MKKPIAILMMGGCLALIAAGTSWAGDISTRHGRQCKRIHQGVHSGTLNRVEARTLFREQRRIRHTARWAWADGHLTRPERVRLHRMQKRASRHIHVLKHNRRPF